MKRAIIVLILLALPAAGLRAEVDPADSSAVKRSDRGVMLNAESATAPRVLNIGLPESA